MADKDPSKRKRGDLNKGLSPPPKESTSFRQGGGGTAFSQQGDGGVASFASEQPVAGESLAVVPMDDKAAKRPEPVSIASLPIELLSVILEFVMNQYYMDHSLPAFNKLMFQQANSLANVSRKFREALNDATINQLSLPPVPHEKVQQLMNLAFKLFRNIRHLNLRTIQMTEGNPELPGLQSLIVRNTQLSKLSLGRPRRFTGGPSDLERQMKLLDSVADAMEERNTLSKYTQQKFKKFGLYMKYCARNQDQVNRLLGLLTYLETLFIMEDGFVNAETIEILSKKENLYRLDFGFTIYSGDLIRQMARSTAQPNWLLIALMIAVDEEVPEMAELIMKNFETETKVLMEGIQETRLLNPRSNFVFNDETLLEYAIKNEKYEIAAALLDQGADPLFTLKPLNGNILQWVMYEVFEAEMNESEPTFEPFLMLLLRKRVDINAKDSYGMPYFWKPADYINEIDVIKWLTIFVDYGANINLRNEFFSLLEYTFLDRPFIKSFELFDFLVQNTDLSVKDFDVVTFPTIAEKFKEYLETQLLQLTPEDYAEKTKNEERALPFKEYRAAIRKRLSFFQSL